MLSVRFIAVALLLTLVAASSDDMYQKAKRICAKVLQLPADLNEQLLNSMYPETHDTYCFVRCCGLVNGLYDDNQGLMVDRLYEADNFDKSREEFTELMRACQAENGPQDGKSHCRKAFKPLMCFARHLKAWRRSVASGN